MAKKQSEADFNMSEEVRDLLTKNPKLGNKDVFAALMTKFPTAKINKNSYSVAFYTCRKKLGIKSSGRGKRISKRTSTSPSTGRQSVDLAMLQTTARFLNEVGGAAVALEAIKQVQAVQVK